MSAQPPSSNLPPTQRPPQTPPHPGWDALLVALLTVATLQINGFAQSASLPTRVADVARHPWLGGLLPPAGLAAMGEFGPIPGDPIGLLLNALALLGLLAYLIADSLPWPRRSVQFKWVALMMILVMALFLPTVKLILLRAQSGPASYSHDGGVIQTEATIEFLLAGKNPYVEDYVETPMAEWGFSEFRSALYHYPYLPWTFLFSAPFYRMGETLGHYDQRWLYLALMAIALALAPRLASTGRAPRHDTYGRAKLALVATLALNPVMNLDITFGQNDVFVFCWMLFSLVAWKSWRQRQQAGTRADGLLLISTICYGLACASKPTAWFFAPFYALLLIIDQTGGTFSWPTMQKASRTLLIRGWPAFVTFLLLVLPYLLWNPAAFYDDVWRWSNGQGETGYQIWGWGASNFVLALGWVSDRFAQWPFLIVEALLALPLLLWFLWRQWRANTISMACWHYAIFLFAFFYGSRFLNENYLGFILAFLAVGLLSGVESQEKTFPKVSELPGR